MTNSYSLTFIILTMKRLLLMIAVATLCMSCGSEDGAPKPQAVDLGLSVKWASFNVGAAAPGEYGDFYAWGETATKSRYDEQSCSTYWVEMEDIAATDRDVAHVKWGDGWRMPTEAEMEELVDMCTWEWTTEGGNEGYKVTGPNGNSIFLPAAGYKYYDAYGGDSHGAKGYRGFYWGSTPYALRHTNACNIAFDAGSKDVKGSERHYGSPVRPVKE